MTRPLQSAFLALRNAPPDALEISASARARALFFFSSEGHCLYTGASLNNSRLFAAARGDFYWRSRAGRGVIRAKWGCSLGSNSLGRCERFYFCSEPGGPFRRGQTEAVRLMECEMGFGFIVESGDYGDALGPFCFGNYFFVVLF